MQVEVAQDKTVVELTINREQARNALNSETIDELIRAFRRFEKDPTVHAIILTGAGDRAFCSGADLKEVQQLAGVEARRRYFGAIAELIETMGRQPQLVIAAVFGYTLAGGMGLAAGADFLVAADDTVFGLPEIKIGLFPMVVMAPIMRLIGRRRTLELVMSGRLVDARTMEQWGFCNRVVPRERVHQDARQFALEVTPGSAAIARLGKEALRGAEGLSYEDALHYLHNMVSLTAMTEDSQEGIAAFLGHREPDWHHQ
ncbi:MAG: enoyl-CoA hydratase/isomerase family protein [Sulfobacillus sp.]